MTICHATRSAKNPYVVITVDASSISQLMSAIGNGHGVPTGAVFDPAVNSSGDNWGDIITAGDEPAHGCGGIRRTERWQRGLDRAGLHGANRRPY